MKIGVDLGGHTIVAARIRDGSEGDLPAIDAKVVEATPAGRCPGDVLGAVVRIIEALSSAGGEIEGVGLAIPAMVDADRRHARKMPNFPPEWDDLDIPAALERILLEKGRTFPVRIENDANCYALGEGFAGVAVGVADYVVLTMGTGIGSGIVIGGRLLAGAHGMAGEAGHVVIEGMEPCGCGGIGHAETLAATDGTVRRARASGLSGDFRELWAMRGNPVADKVLNTTLDAMGRTVATVCHVLDPACVVLGGGMSAAAGIGEAVREATLPYLSRPFKPILDIRISKLGNDAALFGAASI